MTRLMMPLAVVGLMLGSLTATAGENSECLKSGDAIGAFYVTKVAGAEEDGVENGEQLCYRCRYGSRPMVMVFARDAGGKLGNLVKEIDAAVAQHEDAQLKGFVTFMGQDASALKDTAAKFAKKSRAKNVPMVVAKDNVTGPPNYKLDQNAAVTVIVASDSQVVASKSFKKADQVDVASVMNEVKKAVN
jgi:hypothetical protein